MDRAAGRSGFNVWIPVSEETATGRHWHAGLGGRGGSGSASRARPDPRHHIALVPDDGRRLAAESVGLRS